MERTKDKQKLSREDYELIRITIRDKIYYCVALPVPRYFVSTCGNIISYKTRTNKRLNGAITFSDPCVLKEFDNGTGYKKVHLCSPEGKKTEYVHRLVAQAFLVKPEGSKHYEVNHLDFDRSNNAIANLEIVTRQENQFHARTLKHLKQAS